jgi:glucose-1-phosphate thymidylyltransferase
MKGIVLAGGTGSRLFPITSVVSKQLLPVYDKPMIFYPISTLLLAGVRDILIITTPRDVDAFKDLLGDGSIYGVTFEYLVQPNPGGLAQAFILGEDFIGKESCAMILGDNIFHGVGLGNSLQESFQNTGARIFTYEVSNPSDYGVLTLDENNIPLSVEEKPKDSKSNLAITGLYFFDNRVVSIAKALTPSSRGELEITGVINRYLQLGDLKVTQLSRGTAWLDTGNFNSLHDASTYIRILQERQGLRIGDLIEIARSHLWIP